MWQWLLEVGFPLIQTLGVVGGLFYAGKSFELDRRTRRVEIQLSLTEAHRDLWQNLLEHPGLGRILDPEANLENHPITPEERRFVILLFNHIAAVHKAIEEKAYDATPGMDQDIAELIRLPIPGQIADEILPYQSHSFQRYLAFLHPTISNRPVED